MIAGARPESQIREHQEVNYTKKTQPLRDCVKSTPKEEGGGDTVWITKLDPTEGDYRQTPSEEQAFFVHRTINVLIAR